MAVIIRAIISPFTVHPFNTTFGLAGSIGANNGVDNATNYTLRYATLSTDSPYGKIKNYQLGFFIHDKWKLRETFARFKT